jgi:hypothetical protein
MLDLYELKKRRGGGVSTGGTQWNGPGPGHSPRDRSLSVTIKDGRPVLHSFTGDSFAACAAHLGLEASQMGRLTRKQEREAREARQRVLAAERAEKLAFCQRRWSETLPASGTAVETYLRSRAITGPIPERLRFHPAMPLGYISRTTAPAMVAVVTDKQDKPCGLHATFLRPDGAGKADVESPKKMFGRVGGGAIRLTPLRVGPVDPGYVLAIAEGIETALSYTLLHGIPAWAAMTAIGLERFDVPDGITTLIAAADADAAGVKAADALIGRYERRLRCGKHMPPGWVNDFNDALMMGMRP